MQRYYFLSSLLNPQNDDNVVTVSLTDFIEMIYENFSSSDLRKARVLWRYLDLSVWQLLWAGSSCSFSCEHGSENLVSKMTVIQETQMYSDRESLEPFFCDFLHKYPSSEEKLSHFSELVIAFFSHYKGISGFVGEYLNFKNDLRILLASYRARQHDFRLSVSLHDTEKDEPFTQYILRNEDSPLFLFPKEYEDLSLILEENYKQPSLLRSKLLDYEASFVNDLSKTYFDSADFILAHAMNRFIKEQQSIAPSSAGEDKITLIEKAIA